MNLFCDSLKMKGKPKSRARVVVARSVAPEYFSCTIGYSEQTRMKFESLELK